MANPALYTRRPPNMATIAATAGEDDLNYFDSFEFDEKLGRPVRVSRRPITAPTAGHRVSPSTKATTIPTVSGRLDSARLSTRSIATHPTPTTRTIDVQAAERRQADASMNTEKRLFKIVPRVPRAKTVDDVNSGRPWSTGSYDSKQRHDRYYAWVMNGRTDDFDQCEQVLFH